MRQRDFVWFRLVLMLFLLMPLAVLFLMPGTGMVLGTMWFWLVLMLCFWMIWMVCWAFRAMSVRVRGL